MFGIKSQRFKDILIINKFLFNDSLNGVLGRPFFKKKFNIFLLVFILILLYFGYFYLNMIELAKLNNHSMNISMKNLVYIRKLTLSSYYNAIFIITSYIFFCISLTLNLSKNTIFFIKTLPFDKKNLFISMVIFKLIIGLGLFELILVIIAPALKLLGLSLYMSAIVLVTFHLIFITLFEFFDYFYNILNIFSNKISKVTKFIFMMFILLISSIHMIRTRFIVDFWIAKQNFKINQFIFLSMFLMIILMVIILLVQINNNYQEIINDKSKFINFVNLNSVPHKHIPVWFSAISIIRIKNFWSLFLSIILVLFIALYSSGIENTTQLFMLIFPLLGISWMYYADSTLNIRRMFQAYRITINDEIIGLLIIIFMISFPVLILGQEKLKNFDPFLYMVNVSIIGLISGFLFPKSKGNMNETISSILSLILIVMLTLIVNLNELLIPITVLSLSILYFVIKKESELKI